MTNLEYLEKKRAELKAQQDEIDRQIEATKAKQEQDRQIDLAGLYHRMESLIKTSSSSMSDNSIGEIRETDSNSDEDIAEAYMRTIDVEISGRYRDDHETVIRCGVNDLARPLNTDDPTLVVSFLIPFDLVEDDPFFNKDS